MRHSTTVGADLAKNVIQIWVISGRRKELSNRTLIRDKFAEFTGKQKPSLGGVCVMCDITLLGAVPARAQYRQ